MMLRTAGGIFGVFILANLLFATERFDGNLWWIDLRALPLALSQIVLLACAAVSFLLAFNVRHPSARIMAAAVFLIVSCMETANCIAYWTLLAEDRINGYPMPFTVLFALLFAALAWRAMRPFAPPAKGGGVLLAGVAFAACLFLFPLALMYFFGKTDYARQADCIVVFGARAYADGRPSQALADRVRTACELYKQGLAPVLIFSGGPGDGAVHETESMRRLAMELGVPDAAIRLDPQGLNTRATARNCVEMLTGKTRILAVSHFYHLPRVKMAFQQEGVEVFTVPAKERYTLTKMPWLMTREVAAFWTYYLRLTT
ncbi:MAG TPA: YdcF family protein [Planctomycetota bacterium]|nr:YdcF family protein [Planctomycetota bacterium]